MSSPNIKIDGRKTYQRRYSMSPNRDQQISNKYEGTDEQFVDHEDETTCQSRFPHGSPHLRKKTALKTPEELEPSAEEFSTTPEDLSTTKEFSATFNDHSISFKDCSTTSKDLSAEYEGTTNSPSTSKSYSKNLKEASPNCRGSYSIHKTTSKTCTSSFTAHNLPASKKKLPPSHTLESYEPNVGNWCLRWPGSIILIIAVAAVAYAVPKTLSSKRICSFENLKSKYPNQDNMLWKSLHVQIEGILNQDPAVPSAFLFLYTSSKTEELIWNIAKTASACFDPSLEPMKLDKEDFTSQASIADYGVIIKKYKEQVGGGGALVVANLNEIPGKAARALHAICDTYNPIIDRVVIFMTLRVPNEVGKPIEVAENTLNEIWGPNVERHELDPLITRVTEQVFYLSS